MPVHHVAERGQGSHGVDEHSVAEHGPAHIGNKDVGNDAHAGDDGDVNLRVSEEPEEVLPEESGSARVRQDMISDNQVRSDKEAGAGDMIEDQKDAGGNQHCKCGEAHD